MNPIKKEKMETFAKTIKILVVSLHEDWPLFCALDEKRLLFFKSMNMGSLPIYFSTGPDTTIKVYRDKKEISTALIYTRESHGTITVLQGFEGIVPKNSLGDIINDGLKSFYFKDGDSVEIIKDDWKADENPIDVIATRRKVGTPFSEVFKNHPDYIKKFMEFFEQDATSLQQKTVVFNDSPGSGEFSEFF